MNPKRPKPRYIVIKMAKIEDKEKILKSSKRKAASYIKQKLCRPEGSGTIHSRLLNNMGLNCAGSLISKCFSIKTTVLHDPWLVEFRDVEPWIWRADCRVICAFSTVQEG